VCKIETTPGPTTKPSTTTAPTTSTTTGTTTTTAYVPMPCPEGYFDFNKLEYDSEFGNCIKIYNPMPYLEATERCCEAELENNLQHGRYAT